MNYSQVGDNFDRHLLLVTSANKEMNNVSVEKCFVLKYTW